MSHFRERLTQEDSEIIGYDHHDLLSCIHQLAQDESWAFLHSEDARVKQQRPVDLCEWEEWCADHATDPPACWSTLPRLPQALTRYKVLLHAFAGRRRKGDIEWYLDRMAKDFPGFTILTVSVDIIIDSQHGDISNEKTRNLWLYYIRRGFVAGFLAGPPCNTWSRVRAVQLHNGKGPRVIRTPSAPWGLEELRVGELCQVTLGTILLGFAFKCVLALALCNDPGILEHLKDCGDADSVSIWRLPALRMLLQLPGMRLVHVAQGLFGAPSPKPTTLLVLRLFDLEQNLHKGTLSTQMVKGTSVGKDASGHFNTAPLKEYPPGFCKAIAQSFCTNLCTDRQY